MLWLVLWAPVLWFAALTVIHLPGWINIRGVDAEGALQRAARAAAYQITQASYAEGRPWIDPVAAETVARQYLADNLRLAPGTLEPLPGSWLVVAPQVHVAVANGPFPQVTTMPGYPGVQVTFPTPGVIVLVDGTIQTPAQMEERLVHWAAARVYRRGGP